MDRNGHWHEGLRGHGFKERDWCSKRESKESREYTLGYRTVRPSWGDDEKDKVDSSMTSDNDTFQRSK